MTTLTDPVILSYFLGALRDWRYEGCVILTKDAQAGLRKYLNNITPAGFKELLYEFVKDGGRIDQVVEKRANWSGIWPHHYDLRPTIDGVKIYVETRLCYEDPKSPVVHVVNIHLP